jgi:hypothetical protein
MAMPRIEQEARTENGTLLPEVEVTTKNAITEEEYADDTAADADVADPNTATTADNIVRAVSVRVLKGIQSEGKS